ncbi:MAG: zinc ribbon domain-containing protein [Candidatus Omnitrophica bacterium]|nr:zinc ribbon domain-containing protein [Candidatus Omnitrophota bacterium]
MADCKSCGYWIPDGAKKCAHCGADISLTKPQIAWKWVSFITNLGAIAASFATCVMAIVMLAQSSSMEKQSISLEEQTQALKVQAASIKAQTKILQKNFELEYIPVIKIGAVAFNYIPYSDRPDHRLVMMYFIVPIENKHGFAENIKIIKKEIVLLRGTFNLQNAECMRGPLVERPFELSSGQIKYDTIKIDEEAPNFEKVMEGKEAFILEYKIEYEALPGVVKGSYIYNYVIKFSGGRQEVITENTIPPKETAQ